MNKLEKILLLSFSAVVVILLAVLLLRPEKKPEVVVGEFTPPPFEPAAVAGVPDLTTDDGFGTLALTPEMAVSMCASPVVENGQAQVFFTSPDSNTAWIRLRLLDAKGNLLGETGVLRPGEYVEFVSLTFLPKKAEVVARILTYEPETWYSLGSANAQLMLDLKD